MTEMLSNEKINAGLDSFIDAASINCAFYQRGCFAAVSGEERRFAVDLGFSKVCKGGCKCCLGVLEL